MKYIQILPVKSGTRKGLFIPDNNMLNMRILKFGNGFHSEIANQIQFESNRAGMLRKILCIQIECWSALGEHSNSNKSKIFWYADCK